MRAVVFNLGCKVNQYESDVIAAELRSLGYSVSEELCPADLYVLNTCAVTAEAERKSRQAVTRAKKHNPNAKIIVTGCAGQNDQKQFTSREGVVFVSGCAAKSKIAQIAATLPSHSADTPVTDVEPLPIEYEYGALPALPRTRAYVKVQDGCNNFCSYCLIPYLRGRSRSRSIQDIAVELEALPSTVREIVLIGINLSAYGKDCGSSLTDLLKGLNTSARIRFGSLEANVIDREFLDTISASKNVCAHFHLSLQSGSESVLKKMNRHYTPSDFAEKVELIREYFPDAGITTDVIAGFPTETDQEFWETYDFCKAIGFSAMHCFPYSRRVGTNAAKLEQVPPQTLQRRTSLLIELGEQLKFEFLHSQLGKKLTVLVEEDGCGYSENYLRCRVPNASEGDIVTFCPTSFEVKRSLQEKPVILV